MEQNLDVAKIYNHAAETIKNAILKARLFHLKMPCFPEQPVIL